MLVYEHGLCFYALQMSYRSCIIYTSISKKDFCKANLEKFTNTLFTK